MKDAKVIELEEVTIRFSGDSGDGMQLTGTLFSDATAIMGRLRLEIIVAFGTVQYCVAMFII